MNCRSCGYALWNLSEPRCPECGTGFDLRSYRFRPGSVGFACPHCGHLHGGAGEAYLPASTDRATCLGCGQVMEVPSMRVVPLVEDLREAEALSSLSVPWTERKAIGTWKAWWDTVALSISHPGQLASRIHPETRWGPAYWFTVMTFGMGLAVTALLLVLACGGMGLLAMGVGTSGGGGGGGGGGQVAAVFLGMMGAIVGMLIVSAFVIPLALTVFVAGPAHLMLLLTGSKRGGFGLTAVSVLYSQGPNFLMAIPIIGYYFSSIWQIWALVVCIIVTAKTQNVGGWRASLAFLWFPLLMMVLGVGILVVAALLG